MTQYLLPTVELNETDRLPVFLVEFCYRSEKLFCRVRSGTLLCGELHDRLAAGDRIHCHWFEYRKEDYYLDTFRAVSDGDTRMFIYVHKTEHPPLAMKHCDMLIYQSLLDTSETYSEMDKAIAFARSLGTDVDVIFECVENCHLSARQLLEQVKARPGFPLASECNIRYA